MSAVAVMPSAATQDVEAWVRRWFEEHLEASDVFARGQESLTLEAAVRLVQDFMAAERDRAAEIVEYAQHAANWNQREALAKMIREGRRVVDRNGGRVE